MPKTLFKVLWGSHLYGLATPASDLDYGFVFLESKSQIFGVDASNSLPQIITEEKDENRHWLKNFAVLCKRGNPNAIEWLWASGANIEEIDPVFRDLILANSDAFLGLVGLTPSHFGFAQSLIKKMHPSTFLEDNTMSHRMRSKNGKVGQARRSLVEAYGYDTKAASHAARLMLQLQAIVENGKISYPFTGSNLQQIMDIKSGKVPNAEIDGILDHLKDTCSRAVERNAAGIPPEPDHKRINDLMIRFYGEVAWDD